MQQLSKLLGRVLSVVTALVIIVMMLHVVINALSRFFFSTPIYGTNEIAGFWYLPIIALLGIPVAQLQREHIVVALLLDRMSARAAGWCMLLASLATAAVCAGFAWFGLHRAVEQMELGATAGVTTIITWPVFFLLPVVFGLMTLICVLEAITYFRAVLSDEPEQVYVSEVEKEIAEVEENTAPGGGENEQRSAEVRS